MRKLVLNNFIYYSALFTIVLISTYLNYFANWMQGLIKFYEEYAIYLSSYATLKNDLTFGTFPMWGYGFVLLLFKSKLLIILLQQILTISVILYSEYILKQYKICSKLIFQLRLFILFSINLFFVQTSLCPDGIGINLLALSVLTLVLYFKNKKNWTIILSAIFYGLMLNFRSDFYYFQFILLVILLTLRFFKKIELKYTHLLLWIFTIQVLLIPWGLHTKSITGKYLQVSTNGGHVMFIGLGQLPNNPWGISPHDGDSVMQNVLETKDGHEIASCSYTGDKVLKKKWIQLVTDDPISFFQKCTYNVYKIIRNPFYAGNIDKRFLVPKESEKFRNQIKYYLNNGKILQALQMILSPPYLIFIFSYIINIWGISIFLLFFFYLTKYMYLTVFSFLSDPLILILLSLIIYQLSILILFFFMSFYHMFTMLFYILLIFIFKQKIIDYSRVKNY